MEDVECKLDVLISLHQQKRRRSSANTLTAVPFQTEADGQRRTGDMAGRALVQGQAADSQATADTGNDNRNENENEGDR